MKARKIAGIRLVNYIEDGITWKSHKDVILDFWITKKCQEAGYSPFQFRNMFRVVQLPTAAQQKYEEWFNHYDFQNETDKDWLEFVNGTLNLFYHTSEPVIEPDETWFIDLMQSEVEARGIVAEQVYHGSPNLEDRDQLEARGSRRAPQRVHLCHQAGRPEAFRHPGILLGCYLPVSRFRQSGLR